MKRNIDIGLLRAFLAIAEHRNMTYAATLLNLTQSAVSQQIKRLEENLSSQILIRSPGGVTLTKAGQKLLPKAIAMVRTNDEIVASMMDAEVQTEVRLGVPQDVVSSLLPNALATFHRAKPDVQVTLVSASSYDLIEMLKEGLVDIALTTDRNSDPSAVVLFKKRLIWIGAIGGAAYHKKPLPVAIGHESCPFRLAASSVLSSHRLAWKAVTQVGSLEPVFATLMADIAVAPFLPGTLPPGTEEVPQSLPELPEFHLHLRFPIGGLSASASDLSVVLENALKN